MKKFTFTHVKAAFWLVAFAAICFFMFCKLYWPAILPMFVAFHFYEKNADKIRASK